MKGTPELNSYFKTRGSNLGAGLTTFDTMWALFVPDQEIYAKPFLNCPQVFKVETPPYRFGREMRLQPMSLDIDCWCYDWNGKEIVKAFYSISIERFIGTKAINELVCYPLKYYKGDLTFRDEQDLRENLIKRGSKYNTTVRGRKGAQQMYEYHGDALPDKRNVNWRAENDQV